jgi:hypothetical protein
VATLTTAEIALALERLGELAASRGKTLKLVLVGGALMALRYSARDSTKDVDAIAVDPESSSLSRELSRQVANELGWAEDWLNDGAKGYLVGMSTGPVVFAGPGIEVVSPSVAQLLAMKLAAWRDDLDISDATRLLAEIKNEGERSQIWESLEPFLPHGCELKAKYAFEDLWESSVGELR